MANSLPDHALSVAQQLFAAGRGGGPDLARAGPPVLITRAPQLTARPRLSFVSNWQPGDDTVNARMSLAPRPGAWRQWPEA